MRSLIKNKHFWLSSSTLILLAVFLAYSQIPATQPDHEPIPLSGAARISISQEGMYAIRAAELRAVGLPVEPDSLFLHHLGNPQPLWYSGEGGDFTLYFYGRTIDDPYTNENVYLLSTDSHALPSIQLPNHELPLRIPAPLRLEENLVYFPNAEPSRTWFWKTLTAPAFETIEFSLPAVEHGEGNLRAAFFASTEAAGISPDHHLRLLLNNHLVLDETWDGRGIQEFKAAIPDGVLTSGNNSISIEIPGDTGVVIESVLLDWIEIDFPQGLDASAGQLGFLGTGEMISLDGLRSGSRVFDLTLHGNGTAPPTLIQPLPDHNFASEQGHLYLAVNGEAFYEPSISPAWLAPDLRSSPAEYIAIGPPELLSPLQPLLDHRESQGISTIAVPLQAVYDQFGGGLAHPEAIRSYLQFASQEWDHPPRFLTLVGDSSYDLRGYQTSPEVNRLPSFFLFTVYGGETSSDIRFVQLDEDLLPDLAVGRIPARTPEQVTILVEKTLSYENSAYRSTDDVSQNWTRRILAIADGQEVSFQRDAEIFLEYFPENFEPILLNPSPGDSDASEVISDWLDEGVLFMSYFGHGSITMLGKDRLFTVEDGEVLKNGSHLPIMINITCLAGFFTHPEADSLTEVMLWNPNGGAVAALSATSLTLPSDQSYLSKALIDSLRSNPEARLGELLLLAQRTLPVENSGVREVMETFLLFGDPALVVP